MEGTGRMPEFENRVMMFRSFGIGTRRLLRVTNGDPH